jgi:2'-5' RNA ligase
MGRQDLRWVDPCDWHVTLSFLGSVPDDDVDGVLEALRGAADSAVSTTATLGPSTTRLGRSVLCVPVEGLGPLADAIRLAVTPFDHSPDRDAPYVGHLTLARARRGGSIPEKLVGRQVAGAWSVSEFCLVASTTDQQGPHYSPLAHLGLRR